MRIIRGTVLAVAGSLALAAPAAATITHTHITKPAKSPSYFTYNYNNPNTFAVAGKTDSTSPSTDTVDILCFYGTGYSTVATGVTLNSKGSFSVDAPLNNVKDETCHLAALPSGQTTLTPAFAGPHIDVGERQNDRLTGGPNNGKRYDYYAWGQQPRFANDYDSISSCGLCDSYIFDATGDQTTTVFYGNAFLNTGNENGSTSTRSDIQVDGRDAYAAYTAYNVFSGARNVPGFPSLSWHFSQNAKTGDVTITETDQFVRCNTPTYPPTITTCTSYKPTGVEVSRKMVQNASGQMVWITDTFKSTDGHAHKVDLLYDNSQCLTNNACSASTIGYRFPGKHGYAAHAPGAVVHVSKGVGSIYVKVLGAPNGDFSTGQGAITFAQAPTKIVFAPPAFSDDSNFTMHYAAKVAAKGTVTYRFVYSTDAFYAQVHKDALAAQKALSK